MTITAHNSLCSTRAYHLRIDLALMPLLGIVAWKTKKFLCTHNDLSMEMHCNEGESVSTYPHRPKAEAFDNAVDVAELLLAPRSSTECTVPPSSAHVQLDDVHHLLDKARCLGSR